MKEITKRTIFGALFVIVVIGSVLLHFYAFAAVMTATVIIGTHELCQLLKPSRSIENDESRCSKCKISCLECEVMVYVVAALVLSIIFTRVGLSFRYAGLFSVLPMIFIMAPFLMALFSRKYSFTEMVTSCWASLIFVTLPCCLLLTLHDSCPLPTINGKLLVITMFALVWINDIFAYLSGMVFGCHPLFKRISPKKTIEGSLGGCAMTILVAYLANHFWLHAMSDIEMIGLAAVIVVFGSLGDLCESMLKRQAGVKDSGNVIPGHGGILDRFDATFLSVPFAYCYLILI